MYYILNKTYSGSPALYTIASENTIINGDVANSNELITNNSSFWIPLPIESIKSVIIDDLVLEITEEHYTSDEWLGNNLFVTINSVIVGETTYTIDDKLTDINIRKIIYIADEFKLIDAYNQVMVIEDHTPIITRTFYGIYVYDPEYVFVTKVIPNNVYLYAGLTLTFYTIDDYNRFLREYTNSYSPQELLKLIQITDTQYNYLIEDQYVKLNH